MLSTTCWLELGLAFVLAWVSLRGAWRLRGTTLVAPCLWVALSACCFAVGAVCQLRLAGIGLSALRYAIAVSTLCPLMAVLGAKRPQDRGWQWVVLTLWIVLVWPALQAVLLPAGVRVELFIAWKLFLWALIVVGLLNYLPTRSWLAALLVAAGQMLLLRDHLGWGNGINNDNVTLAALGCFCLAALLVAWRGARNKPTPRDSPLAAHDSAWLRFRDSFGAFWALRVLGRVNQAAEIRDWPMRLEWSGFTVDENQAATPAQRAELEVTMTTLLRRFVAVSNA